MRTYRSLPAMAVLVLILTACGGSGSEGPDTTSTGAPGTTSSGSASTTNPGTSPPEGGGGGESWIEIDGVRRTPTTVCNNQNESISVVEFNPKFLVIASLYEDGDLRVSVDTDDLGGVARSEDGYKWVDQAGLPIPGLELTFDSSGIRGGPVTLTDGEGATAVANFDLRFGRATCWPDGDEWANLSGPTPSGRVYARFDVDGEIVEFDESQIVECSFDSRITDSGRIVMATPQDVVPRFRLTVGFSLSQFAHFAVFTEQGAFGAGLDNPGDVHTVQGQGRTVQGTAVMRTDSGEIPISFEASCG